MTPAQFRSYLQQQAIRQLQSRPVVMTRYVTFRTSVETLHRSYVSLDRHQGYAPEMSELLDLSERENANSLDVIERPDERAGSATRRRRLGQIEEHALTTLSQDLDSRWRGALVALDPRNPDASRHFCTSSREIFTEILEKRAPDAAVLQTLPSCALTRSRSVPPDILLSASREAGGRIERSRPPGLQPRS